MGDRCDFSDSPQPEATDPVPERHAASGLPALSRSVKRRAISLGFDHCRIVPVEEALHADFFDLWLALGRAAEMTYLERHAEKRRDPGLLSQKSSGPFRTVIVLAVNYYRFELPDSIRHDPSRGLIASYAWSDDYHEIIRPLLYEIDAHIRAITGRSSPGKCLVDTGPVLERDWAQTSGIGFTGKNCCTIHPGQGSWLLLATILVPEVLGYDVGLQRHTRSESAGPGPEDVSSGLLRSADFGTWKIPLEPRDGRVDEQWRTGTCGHCTRCMDSCPTDAFVGPFHLDPVRCISYWTIESREPIPRQLRRQFGNLIFGCDICQDVCPWNRGQEERAPLVDGLRARRQRMAPHLLDGFRPRSPYWLVDAAFQDEFRSSPLLRPGRTGMLRNVCVALGNWASPLTLPALTHALHDADPIARGHAVWAIGRVAGAHQRADAANLLSQTRERETSEYVRSEIGAALGEWEA